MSDAKNITNYTEINKKLLIKKKKKKEKTWNMA